MSARQRGWAASGRWVASKHACWCQGAFASGFGARFFGRYCARCGAASLREGWRGAWLWAWWWHQSLGGLTTLLVVLAAWIFGLSKFASVIGSHVVAPLHLLLFIPFIDLGVHVFHTRKLPMDRRELEHLGHHPVRLLHEIWQWEWHALIIWGLLAAIAMPLLVLYLRRALIVLLRRHRTLVRSRPAVR
jgi:hypothetical protein